MTLSPVNPDSWPKPRGYANGMVGEGRQLFVAGQIAWTPEGEFPHDALLGQFGLALDNVIAVVRAAGGEPADIATMTVFCTDIPQYRAIGRDLGPVWRERMGKHYPAMALVGATELVEPKALIEIQATALLSK